MNARIEKMIAEIQRRGGRIHLPASLPDEVAEQFLEEILDCPQCRAATPIDRVLGTASVFNGSKDH